MIKNLRGAWIALPVLALDRITKRIALRAVSAPLIPGVIRLRLTSNTGAAFSMLNGKNTLLILITLALIAFLTVCALRNTFSRAGLWLIIGGALGNVYDRIVYGNVIDFLDVECFHFAVFNIADACIVIGAIWIALRALSSDKREKP